MRVLLDEMLDRRLKLRLPEGTEAVVVMRARSNRYRDLLPLMEEVGAALRRTRAGEAAVVGEVGRGRGGGEAR